MSNPNVIIDDLKNQWVVFKKIKKQNFYHRGSHYSQCSTNARQACKYPSKELAVAEQTKLNQGRKSYRFRVETADRHFVSNWNLQYHQYNKQIIIKNEPISFRRVSTGTASVSQTLNDKKAKVLQDIAADLDRTVNSRNTIEDRYKASIAMAEKQREESIKSTADAAARLLQVKSWVENTDLDTEYVEKYQTETDKKAYILFGKKEHVNT